MKWLENEKIFWAFMFLAVIFSGSLVSWAMGPDTRSPLTVFGPKTEMLIGGQLVKVTGSDECPRGGLVAMPIIDLNPLCIVIDDKRKVLTVHVEVQGTVNKERWTVERNGNVTTLRREDGSLVVPANVPTTK